MRLVAADLDLPVGGVALMDEIIAGVGGADAASSGIRLDCILGVVTERFGGAIVGSIAEAGRRGGSGEGGGGACEKTFDGEAVWAREGGGGGAAGFGGSAPA